MPVHKETIKGGVNTYITAKPGSLAVGVIVSMLKLVHVTSAFTDPLKHLYTSLQTVGEPQFHLTNQDSTRRENLYGPELEGIEVR